MTERGGYCCRLRKCEWVAAYGAERRGGSERECLGRDTLMPSRHEALEKDGPR
jgi:hypothetical protein